MSASRTAPMKSQVSETISALTVRILQIRQRKRRQQRRQKRRARTIFDRIGDEAQCGISRRTAG